MFYSLLQSSSGHCGVNFTGNKCSLGHLQAIVALILQGINAHSVKADAVNFMYLHSMEN